MRQWDLSGFFMYVWTNFAKNTDTMPIPPQTDDNSLDL